jgi:hypothetical protein
MTRVRNSRANSASRVIAVRTLDRVATASSSRSPPNPQKASRRSPRSEPVSGTAGVPFWARRASMTREALLVHRR